MKTVRTIAVILAAVMICLSLSACCNGNYGTSSAISSYTISMSLATSSATTQTDKFTISTNYTDEGWGVQPSADYLLQINSSADIDYVIRIRLVQTNEGGTALEAANNLITNINNGTNGVTTLENATLYTTSPTETTLAGKTAYYVEYAGMLSGISNKHFHCWYLEVEGQLVLVTEEYPVTTAERDRTQAKSILDSLQFIPTSSTASVDSSASASTSSGQ